MRKLTTTVPPTLPDAKLSFSSGRKERTQAPFRTRLFAVLLLFAVIPSIALTVIWAVVANQAIPMVTATSAWERVARSGEHAMEAMRAVPLDSAQRDALDAHETELRQSVELAKRFGYVAPRSVRLITIGAVVVLVLVAIGGSRVAGHLSRQLSRPLDELVGWTGLIRSENPLPGASDRPGAPEFEVLRTGMRTMAAELALGRQRALEAERANAYRESARQFAHELKNPLTPIRFAVDRLRREVPESLNETVGVLAEEASRLEAMARSFAQFGRLPDGPSASVDIGDLVTRTARSTVPGHHELDVIVDEALPLINGYHEALVRAVSNVLINAVEACAGTSRISVRVSHDVLQGNPAIRISIRDNGPGIPAATLSRVFDPYVTTKPGGTGLGLAIARQTVTAHLGVIEAESTPGQGTEIRLRLPLAGMQATHS